MPKSKYALLMEKLEINDNNWEERFRLLRLVQETVPTLTSQALPDIYKHFYTLNNQLLNVRSKVAKEAGQVIVELARKYKDSLTIADLLVRESLKGLNSANNVLRECVHETIEAILIQCSPEKSIHRLVDQFQSKNSYVRQRVAEYLLIVVERMNTEKHRQMLEDFIQKGLNDKVQTVRRTVRKIYIKFEEQYPEAKKILLRLDPVVTRLLHEKSRSHMKSNQRHSLKQRQSVESNKQNQQNCARGRILRQNINLKSLVSQRQSINSVGSYSRQKSSENKLLPDKSSIFASYILPINASKPQSVEQSRNRIKSQKRQDIEFLIQKVQSHLWNTRLISLTKLIEILQTNQYSEILTPSNVKLVIGSIVKKLDDTHQKVVAGAVEGLAQIFPYYPNQCFSHSFSIVRRCVKGMTEKSKDIFLQLMSILKAFDMSQVFSSVIKLIQQCKTKEKLICLDIIIEILECDPTLIQPKDVNHLFKLMTNLISENKTAAIPALAVISILKTSHQSRMWSCFITLSDTQLNRMVELAAQIDPSLESVIANITKNNPRPAKSSQSVSMKQREMSLLNVSELQAISRNPEFINQYIGLIYEKVKHGQDPALQRLSVIIKNNSYLKEQSLYKLFEILHLSSNETVLLSVNSILDLLVIEAEDMFVKCLCEVIKLAKGIHLDMYLEKLQNLIRMAAKETLESFVSEIVDAILIHLNSQELELRRTSIMILAQLSTRIENIPLELLKPHERRLVQKYSKQLS